MSAEIFPSQSQLEGSKTEVEVTYESYRSANEKSKSGIVSEISQEDGEVEEFKLMDSDNDREYIIRVDYRGEEIIESRKPYNYTSRKTRLGEIEDVQVITSEE